MIDTSLFLYENYPIRLQFGEKKQVTVCWFECQEHLDKYVERYKLDKRTIKIDYRDGEPVSPSKRNKRSVEQTPKPKSNRGSGSVQKRKSSVDSTGNTARTTKRKK